MSSVAVLTQESFAEHRSGLVPQQIKVATLNSEEESDPPTYKDAFLHFPRKQRAWMVPRSLQEHGVTRSGPSRPLLSLRYSMSPGGEEIQGHEPVW